MIPPRSSFNNILTKNHCYIFFGTSSLTLGLILFFLKSWIIQVITASVIVLKPNNIMEGLWRKTPIDIPTNVYFFNWTNPEDIHDFKINPKFEEVGPYKFYQKMEKVNVIWNDNNTVTYNQMRTFTYDKQNPNGNLSDKITSLNAVTLACSHYIQDWNYFIKRAASIFMSAVYPTVDVTRTANQFLLEGYDDIMVDIANYLPFIATEIPRFDKFGWLFVLNGSSVFEGTLNIDNGEERNFEVQKWNYQSKVSQFDGPCSKIEGSSAGELFPHKITPTYVQIFVPQICRSLRFDYEDTVHVSGILGYKFTLGAGVLDNGTTIPENECYCAGKCVPSGVFNVSSCRYGLPVYGSLPHFYKADKFYSQNVDGLKPERSKHESYIVLEPTTGIPIEAALRIQLNMLLHPIKNIMVYEDVPEIYFPLFWIECIATLPTYMIILLKIYLAAPYILIVTSVILVLVGLYILLFKAYRPFFVSLYKQLHKQKKPSNSTRPEEVVPLRQDAEEALINTTIDKYECEKSCIGRFTLR